MSVKIGLIKLLQKKFDLCEEAYVVLHLLIALYLKLLRRKANATVQCPVKPGSYHVEQTVALPKEIPPGKLVKFISARTITSYAPRLAKFVVNVRGYSVEEEDLLCLDLKVDFTKHWLY